MSPPRIDFAAVAAAALSAAERLVPRWLPEGKRNGHEWVSPNPTRSDRHAGSFSVNLTTGAWADFATGDKGGDLVALRAYLSSQTQLQAAREISEDLHLDPIPPQAPTVAEKRPESRSEWCPVVPVPADAPEAPVAHTHRGRPERTWAYRGAGGELLGFVHRFKTSDGGKEILPCVWARNGRTGDSGWRWMQWASPRPLYGLDRLREGRTVLVVEGEKCADAGHQVLGERLDVVSWPGGGKAVDRAGWEPLRGRKVVIWPDCDAQQDKAGNVLPQERQPGTVAAERIAAILAELDCEVRIVEIPEPGAARSGWDIADAIEEGAGQEALLVLLANLRRPSGATPAARAPERRAQGDGWEAQLQRKRGDVTPCLFNVVTIVSNRPEWDGVIGFDEFAGRTMKRRGGPDDAPDCELGEWTDIDTSRAIMWLTREYGITPGTIIVDEAVELIGHSNPFHPVREYLAGLAWDETPRVDAWLEDFLGVARTEYSTRVARWFLVAMIARVMRPGIKFDYCLVLEGAQGLRKSSVLRALAGDLWFSDTDLDLSNKDSMSALRGKWLHEVAEMGSLARAESQRQKSFLSRPVDEFRPAYARREIRCPRQLVFTGTTNEWSWNKDPTGGRRFWPVEIQGEIDVAGLVAVRDQLFAEALVAFRAGERFWPTSSEQRELFDPEQLRRESEDSLQDMVHDWLHGLTRPEFTMGEVMVEALKVDAGKMTRDLTTRVGALLHKMGCGKRERRNGVVRFVYTVPAWSTFAVAQQKQAQAEGRDGPLPI